MQKLKFPFYILSILIIVLYGCENEDTSRRPIGNDIDTPVIDEEGNINLNALQRVNPNFGMENLMQLGASATDLVMDNQFKSITLEIVSVLGFEPTEFAKQNLIQFIEDRLNKPGGVNIIEKTIEAPNVESYNVETIFGEIEAPNRTAFTTADDLAIFIFFADRDDEQTEFTSGESQIILGTAYLNTSFVIYQNTLNRLAGNDPTDIERVQAGTLNHEFCHLLGLVNSEFTPQQQPHEEMIENENGELEGNRHCNVRFCLMEATARLTTDMMNNINLLQLDPLCIEDLRAIGGK